MNEPRYDKGSVPSVIANYRKRQERAMRLLLAFWIGIMLLILGAGYLAYRYLNAKNAPLVENLTTTPTTTLELTPSSIVTSLPELTLAEAVPGEATIQALESPPPAQDTPRPRMVTYTVKQGDTLSSIAQEFGVALTTITALNPLVTPEFLSVGDTLSIPVQGGGLATVTPPPAGTQSVIEYQVVSGDTLAGIASRFGSSIDAIVRENNLASPDEIRVGQTLRIPVEPGAVQTTEPAPDGTGSPTPTQ